MDDGGLVHRATAAVERVGHRNIKRTIVRGCFLFTGWDADVNGAAALAVGIAGEKIDVINPAVAAADTFCPYLSRGGPDALTVVFGVTVALAVQRLILGNTLNNHIRATQAFDGDGRERVIRRPQDVGAGVGVLTVRGLGGGLACVEPTD